MVHVQAIVPRNGTPCRSATWGIVKVFLEANSQIVIVLCPLNVNATLNTR